MPRCKLHGIVLASLAVGLSGCLGTAAENEDGGTTGATSGANGTGGSSGAGGTNGAASSGGHANSSSAGTGAASNGGVGPGTSAGSSAGVAGSSGSGSSGGVSGGATGATIGGTTGSVVTTGTISGGSTGATVSSSGGGTSGGTITTGGESSGGTTGGNAGSSCTVPGNGQPDPCASTGLACIGVSPVSATGTCQLPTDGYACQPSPGCATGNSCIGNAGQTYCYQDCTTTNDCSQAYETCQVAGAGPTGSVCIYETCTQFYAPCNVIGTDDGYCIPFSNPPQAPYGLCMAGAPVDAGLPASCTTFGRAGGLCPVGMFCYTDYETTGTQCEPFCGVEPVNGSVGPSCAAGQFCVQDYGSLYGSCAETCPVPDQASACPAQQNCLVTGQVYADGGPAYTCEP
jgi:hypothetical protein